MNSDFDFIERLERALFDPARPDWLLQHAIAEATGVTVKAAADMLLSGLMPARTIGKLCEFYGISAHWVLCGTGNISAPQSKKNKLKQPSRELSLREVSLVSGFDKVLTRIDSDEIDDEFCVGVLIESLDDYSELKSAASKELGLWIGATFLKHLAERPHTNLYRLRSLIKNKLQPALSEVNLALPQLIQKAA